MIIGHESFIEEFQKLAKKQRLPHGYLFYGPPRVGKALIAKCFAHYLEHRKFPESLHEKLPLLGDALFLGPDENKTIGIDAARSIKNFLYQTPNRSPHRTVVVDNAEHMTSEAQNALLKVAEEPPPRSLIILVAHDAERLWPTLRSRLKRVYFPPVSAALIQEWLVRELDCAPEYAETLAKKSFGAPGVVWALLKDEEFKALQKQALQFLRGEKGKRANLVKSLVENEKFDLDSFLEALIVNALPVKNRVPPFWHALFALRKEASIVNVNPRLQLTALGEQLE